MSKRNYPRLSVEEFGRHLLETNDLDPVYVALVGMDDEASDAYVARWLIAYWCFYHCGAASWLAEHEGDKFWWWMLRAAKNEEEHPTPLGTRWPRGHERRHFRGAQGIRAVEELAHRYPRPEDMLKVLTYPLPNDEPLTFKAVTNRVQTHRGFGPWIGFKVADMVDRVLGLHVSFEEAAVFMFKDPYKAALKVWREKQGLPDTAKPKLESDAIHQVVSHLVDEFKHYQAPPFRDRPVGLQEVETVLCKWKSHMNGHYPKYNDIDDINQGLEQWAPHSDGAKLFLKHMPKHVGE